MKTDRLSILQMYLREVNLPVGSLNWELMFVYRDPNAGGQITNIGMGYDGDSKPTSFVLDSNTENLPTPWKLTIMDPGPPNSVGTFYK
jgi:hypothetical protein